MKRAPAFLVVSLSLIWLAAHASAEVMHYSRCKLVEGKTIADVQNVNKTWLAFVHDNVSDEISSSIATSIVGDAGNYMFVDSYPDLATWAAAKKALDSDEGNAIEAQFAELGECNSNRLWNLQPTD